MRMRNRRKWSISFFLLNLSLVIFGINASNDRIIENLKQIVDAAREQDLNDENYNQLLIAQLSEIIEEEEGFRIVNQTKYFDQNSFIDGSGDLIDDEQQPIFYANMSIITIPLVSQIFR